MMTANDDGPVLPPPPTLALYFALRLKKNEEKSVIISGDYNTVNVVIYRWRIIVAAAAVSSE